jgi:urease subunit beta
MIPGEIDTADGELELNVGRATLTSWSPTPATARSRWAPTTTLPRPTPRCFDRAAARGHRLNIAAGTAVRFEPGQTRTVELVALAGDRKVFGFNGQVMGAL